MDISYERHGSGEPLVLLHGIGHHRRAWEPVLDRLCAAHEVIALDLPGFGASPVPAGGMPPGMPALVVAVARAFEEWGLGRPHVAGNSLGGAIALELAYAGLVASATAFSPVGFSSPGELRRALAVLRVHRAAAFLPAPVLRAMFRTGTGRALSFGMIFGRPRRLTAERAVADALALRRGKGFGPVAKAGRGYRFVPAEPLTAGPPAAASMGALTIPGAVPVTVAWGTSDRVLRYRQAALARQRLPAANHVALRGCGHVPMSDDPDLVASVILRTTLLARRSPPPDGATGGNH
jgi:pimeloyl-ACP methyl ester carboxylesterase